MKATQEKIQLAELFNCYSLQHLENYRRCPKVLAEEMRDLETLSRLAHSQFAEIVVVLSSSPRTCARSLSSTIRPSKCGGCLRKRSI